MNVTPTTLAELSQQHEEQFAKTQLEVRTTSARAELKQLEKDLITLEASRKVLTSILEVSASVDPNLVTRGSATTHGGFVLRDALKQIADDGLQSVDLKLRRINEGLERVRTKLAQLEQTSPREES